MFMRRDCAFGREVLLQKRRKMWIYQPGIIYHDTIECLPSSLSPSLPPSPSPCCADNNDGVNVDGVPNTNNRRVYVGNLSWNTAWQGLKDHMKTVGGGEGGREGGKEGGRELGSEGVCSQLDRRYFVEIYCGLPFPHQFLPPSPPFPPPPPPPPPPPLP